MKRCIKMAWRWLRKPRVTPLTIITAFAMNWVVQTSVGHWGASIVSRACFVIAGLSFVGAVIITLAIALRRRAETQPTTPRARECETGNNAEEIR